MKELVDLFVSGKIKRGDMCTSYGWNHDNGDLRDAVCVTVNRECYLTGVGVFDCEQKLEIECKIHE